MLFGHRERTPVRPEAKQGSQALGRNVARNADLLAPELKRIAALSVAAAR